jgi:hypothetical protein
LARKPPKQAKSVATGCHRLPEKFHGKEGVDGSSPSEGLHKNPANEHISVACADEFWTLRGYETVMMGTEARGASNAKAKRELGWTLRYPSWRQGFAEVYVKPTASRPSRSERLRTVSRLEPGTTRCFSAAGGATSAEPRMEPLWSPVDATGGNQQQIEVAPKPRKQARSVATGCDQLRASFHGKEERCAR